MNWTVIGILFLAFNLNAAEESSPKKKLIQPLGDRYVVNEIIDFKPIDGHHFNLKAPQKCAEKAFANPSPRKLSCQLESAGTHKITLSVCDDPESFCTTKEHTIRVTAPKGYKPVKSQKSVRYIHFIPKAERPAPRGFLQNRPKRAQAQAKRKKGLLFIDFFGHWCPPCNLLDETVFSKKEFRQKTKDFVKVKLDADSDLSWDWKAHFKIGGYPTIVVADHNLNEIGRVVGYRSLAAMMKWLDEMRALKNSPISTSKDSLRIGKWHFERGEYAEAEKALKENKTKEAKKILLETQIKVASEGKNDEKKAALLVELLQGHGDDVNVGYWAYQLTQIDSEKIRAHLLAVEKNLKQWRVNPELLASGLTVGDLWYYEAKMREALKETDKAKTSYAECAKSYESLVSESDLKVARGANLERAYCLRKAGQVDEAIKLYETMATAYRGEFAFNYYYARTLFDLEKFPKALRFARKAVMNSYGDNWLRAVTLKAKLEKKLGKEKQARRTVERALKEAVMPNSKQIRSHRYLAALRKVLEGDK